MNKTQKKIKRRACYNRIWSWSPMPCEKHGPRASVTTKTMFFTRHGRPWSNPTMIYQSRSMDMLRGISKHWCASVWLCISVSCVLQSTGIILSMGSAKGGRRHNVTSSLIGWAHTQNDPWIINGKVTLQRNTFSSSDTCTLFRPLTESILDTDNGCHLVDL